MKRIGHTLPLLVALLTLPIGAFAQETGTDAEISDKSLKQLRREAWASEEAFYARYNELNDDPDYVVRCRYETPTGSRLRNHICRARFVSDAYTKNVGRKRASANRTARQDDDPEVVAKTKIFQEKLENLIASDPELQTAYMEYSAARERFMKKLHGES